MSCRSTPQDALLYEAQVNTSDDARRLEWRKGARAGDEEHLNGAAIRAEECNKLMELNSIAHDKAWHEARKD